MGRGAKSKANENRMTDSQEAMLDDAFLDALSDRLFSRLSARISTSILESVGELIKPLTDRIAKLEKENLSLLSRVEALDMQSRACDVIIHGMKEVSFAEAASVVDPSTSVASTRTDTVQAVINTCINELGVNVTLNDIIKAHRIPGVKGKRPVLVTFSSRLIRNRIIQARKSLALKKSHLFLNENLTKSNQEIFAKLRQMKKAHQIHSCWSFNGYIFYKVKAEESPRKAQSMHDLPSLK